MTTEKTDINLLLIGPDGAGKATTIGHLMYKLGLINQPDIDLEKFCTPMDGPLRFSTNNHNFTVIHTSSHRDFIQNMLTNRFQVHSALLVLPATEGEFERAIAQESQTREHLLLANTFGVRQMVVAINKMDVESVNYAEARYTEIVEQTSAVLKQVGTNIDRVKYVPISALNDDNLVELSTNMPWQTESTLLQALDALVGDRNPSNMPLRIAIKEVANSGGMLVVGDVLTGIIKTGMTVIFAPSGHTAKVTELVSYEQEITEVGPGNQVIFRVKTLTAKQVKRGMVAGDPNNEPPFEAASFTAMINVQSHPSEISVGYTPVFECHNAKVACQFTKILNMVNPRTGAVLPREGSSPLILKTHDSAIVELTPVKPLCVERLADYPKLGQLTVRETTQSGVTVIVGNIKSVTKKVPAA
ncbi:hypothetical protein SAMD00019534_077030 [Acytostelium subglobosum LB1]|uniref:hypothetical protein n=1 Tax=Acytostelium subglobosum LB1 TaxID=1410327 RepID=UPI0006450FD4|nr:hypothetical protein SAMD00019534_077030 [Acytostelium subglobosum LB1]GAM24528.1 hypothetical protein SAMD00019534_077030 [Acytostelium subglobosum LB1]|eukprot:XP_012752854.1 hypothetical protein SAMD00019534_077030 [Acytostelium subglobosum LB1]